MLTGDAPSALWQALAAQVAAHGYTLTREDCGQANGLTDPAARTVRVRPDVDDAHAVKTLAHELAHIECGHTTDGYDYRGCRGRAEAEAESVAYIVTAWAGLDSGAYTVPYVAAWSAGDTDVVRAAAATVTAAARRILDHLHDAESTEDPAGDWEAPAACCGQALDVAVDLDAGGDELPEAVKLVSVAAGDVPPIGAHLLLAAAAGHRVSLAAAAPDG